MSLPFLHPPLSLYLSVPLLSLFHIFPSSPLSIPYSIDFALWQTAVAFDPNPVICLYCVLNMEADEISMHYCHPVADSSKPHMCGYGFVSRCECGRESDASGLLHFYHWIQGLFTSWNFGLLYITSHVTLPQLKACTPLKWLLLACWAFKHRISHAFLFFKGILSSFTHPHVIPNMFDFLECKRLFWSRAARKGPAFFSVTIKACGLKFESKEIKT